VEKSFSSSFVSNGAAVGYAKISSSNITGVVQQGQEEGVSEALEFSRKLFIYPRNNFTRPRRSAKTLVFGRARSRITDA